ncbi:MAG: hypothetical protein DRO87_12300 [Candidatus Thorarchaeota archaeon]|nr:MAG: hypothetical protein DRO87_12300 [Candidatus Thorarchaeota archaeon]
MSIRLQVLKDWIFYIGVILTISAGVAVVAAEAMGMFPYSGGGNSVIGLIIAASAIVVFLSALSTHAVIKSRQGQVIGLLMTIGSLLFGVGIVQVIGGFPVMAIGMAVIALSCLSWPCLCRQAGHDTMNQVLGVAAAHDRISISEIAAVTKIDDQTVRRIVYDGIGKGRLSGRMEGDEFVRSAPSVGGVTTVTTNEKEVVKVLVVCPFCGAKTEQGISKCQNCGADL